MYKYLFLLILFGGVTVNSQNEKKVFQGGEQLKYRVHYGIVNAGYATLAVSENKEGYHFTGKGWTVGVTNVFFKVRDQYESFVDKETLSPNHFVRREEKEVLSSVEMFILITSKIAQEWKIIN